MSRLCFYRTGNNGDKTGVDDFLAGGHTLAELKALAVPAEEAVVAEEQEELERNFVYANNRLYLEVRQYDGSYGFAYLDDQGKVKIAAELPLSGQTVKPRSLPTIEGKEIDIVGMPDEEITTARLLSPDELYIKDKRAPRQLYRFTGAGPGALRLLHPFHLVLHQGQDAGLPQVSGRYRQG